MAYAIIEMGGKQYRVEKGDSVLVDRVDAKEGAKVAPKALLYRSDEVVLDGSQLDKVKVDAVVAEHLKGDKIRVFKYRPKKRYRKRAGHRSHLSRIEIKEIKGPSAAKAAAGSTEGRRAPAKTETAPAKESTTASQETAEKKPAPRRKPATRKKEE
jgi:large subunit ribosomal protein L21